MLSRALHAAALAERILSGSLTGTTWQAAGCSAAGATADWCSLRHARSAHPALRPPAAAGYSTATAVASTEEPGLQIHPSAAARLRELQAQNPSGTLVLRIEVEGGGCSGFQYRFKLDDTVKDDDVVFEEQGGRVVCDTISLEFLRGATLEFEDTLMRAAFAINKNPNAEASCGCGSSFAAKMK